MFLILTTILFAAIAAAEVTTSMWVPSPYSPSEVGFYGSVVGVDGERVTMAVKYNEETDLSTFGYEYSNEPQTITFIGSTSLESVITTTEPFNGGAFTMSMGCSMGSGNRAKPTCYVSSNGPAVYSQYCSGLTQEETPDYCLSGSTVPSSIAVQTLPINRNDIQTLQIIITAGEEKLSATAGATVSTASPSATSATSSATVVQAQAQQTGASVSTPTSTAVYTGAAAPMATMVPALAGIGAVAALFL